MRKSPPRFRDGLGAGRCNPGEEAVLTGPPQTVELGHFPWTSARQQHAVDHMDDAVRLKHVLDRDLGSIALGVPDHQRVALALNRNRLALDGPERGRAAVLS